MDRVLIVILAFLGSICCSTASGALSISVGSHQLTQSANQTIDIAVTGGDSIAGFDLVLQIGDGSAGPKVTLVDLESGIFAGKNTGQTDNGSEPRLQFHSITTTTGTLTASGLLLRLTLDATDVPAGAYQLRLGDVEFDGVTFASTFYNVEGNALPAGINNGWLVVSAGSGFVPEPAGIAIIGLAGSLMLQRRRRTR